MSTSEYLIFTSLDSTPCDKIPVWLTVDRNSNTSLYGGGVLLAGPSGSSGGVTSVVDISGLNFNAPYFLGQQTDWGPWREGVHMGANAALSLNRPEGSDRRVLTYRYYFPADYMPEADYLPRAGGWIRITNAIWTEFEAVSVPAAHGREGIRGGIFTLDTGRHPADSTFNMVGEITRPFPRVPITIEFRLRWRGYWE